MQCSNNLKNQALACHNYHDTFKKFPPNHIFSGPTPAQSANTEGFGWQVLIMPFMEQPGHVRQLGAGSTSLVDLLRHGNSNYTAPQIVELLQTKIGTYVCPSDSNKFGPLSHTARHFGGGVGTRASGLGNWQPAATNYMSSRGMRNNNQTNVNNDTHGMFMGIISLKMADVLDGTSNTFLIGERDTIHCRGGTWVGVRNPRGNGTRGFYYNTANARVQLNAPDPPFRWNSRTGCSEGFSSLHPGGAMFAFADGSATFIYDTVEKRPCSIGGRRCYDIFSPGDDRWEPVYGVWERLARRNDGFPVTIP